MTAAAGAPPKAASKSQRAYAWIRERIEDGRYSAGYRLVLGAIAGELDMSVVPVREAIRQLEAEGLVTFEHNVGARVAVQDDTQYRFSMQTLSVLEGAATALAARRLTTADVRDARALNEQLIETLAHFEPTRFTMLNQRFHETLYRKSANTRITELVDAEWSRLRRLRIATFEFVPGRARESVREHEQILQLIEASAPITQIELAARRHRAATLDAYMSHEHADDSLGLPKLSPRNGETHV